MDILEPWLGRHGDAITWWQMSLRAGLILILGVGLVRLAGTRLFGRWGALDIIVSVIIGSNLSRALTGNAPFLATLCASAVLVLLHLALAHLASWWSPAGRLLTGRPACLVRGGRADASALRRHAIGDGDLHEALRSAGAGGLDGVAEVWLERNGDISVVPRTPRPRGRPQGADAVE